MEMIGFRNRRLRTDLVGSSVNFNSAGWLAGVLVVTFLLANSSSVMAQKKYTPEHPFVKEMADRAVEVLQKGAAKKGHNAMAALAIVEHGKRYNKEVPRQNEAM